MNPFHKVLGGILLVAGTTIGAGMLALPVCTGLAGFIPSCFLFLAYWIYMTYTALLLLEVNLWMGEHANIITMAKRTLGGWGQAASWVVYLFLLYSLTTAYIAGGSPIFIEAFQNIAGITLPAWAGPFPLLVIFGYFIFRGTKSVDYINRILMLGLMIAYILLAFLLVPHENLDMIARTNWKFITIGVSVVATSFGFHIIIPTLTDYLHRDIGQLKKVILIGSFIPLVVYILWNFLTLGIIPFDKLLEGYIRGDNGAHVLSRMLQKTWISTLAQFFSFFAIITSFLGVSLSLMDFLADGFKIQKTVKGRWILYFLTFLPPLVITYIDPRAFLTALEYAGAFGVVLLLAVLPALMIWRGRYVHEFDSPYKVPGGKGALVAVLIFSGLIISLEIINRLGLQTLLLG